MRSEVGAFCPRSRRLECLLDFLARAPPVAAEPEALLPALLGFAGPEAADTPHSATNSSARVAGMALRSRIGLDIYTADPLRPAIGLLLIVRWYHAGQVQRKGPVRIAAPQDLEHHVGPRLQLACGAPVIVHGVDGFVVDLGNHVAAVELDVVREAGGLDVGNQNAALPFHAHARSTFRGPAIHAPPEFPRH